MDLIAVVADAGSSLLPSSDVSAGERRREPRYTTDRLTLLHLTRPTGPERILCRILDISGSGMRLRTHRPLDPGTEIRVTLREAFAVAKVRYCIASGEGFDHGIQVEEVRIAAAATN